MDSLRDVSASLENILNVLLCGIICVVGFQRSGWRS